MKNKIASGIVKHKYLIGSLVAITIIGAIIYIKRDSVKSFIKKTFGGQNWFDESLAWYRDQKTKSIIEKLHPELKNKFAEFLSKVEQKLGLQIIAVSGLRTFEEQEALKRQNPSNATAGYSMHNYGMAIDINVIDPKTGAIIARKASSNEIWNKTGVPQLAKELGIKWGGGGAFKGYHDPVHFYIEPNGLKATQLLELKNSGKVDSNGYVKL